MISGMVPLSELQNIAEYDNHELVKHVVDEDSGLNCYIAIHNTNLGNAVGGTRMFPYKTEKEALKDALRLSRAMTYKCTLAGVKFGGGKAVIIGDPKKIKNKKLLESYANSIGVLNGRFYTGEDVGISEEDVQHMLTKTNYFIGKSDQAGDPSPYASLSVLHSLKTAVKHVFGNENLKSRTISVKGVGKVGGGLVELLLKEGAEVYIADIDNNAINKFNSKRGKINIVNPDDIHKVKTDIFSPCAMGGEFNLKTAKEVDSKIICGGANNQLESAEIGDILFSKNILYIPDYVANSGGLLNVVDELEPGGYKKERVLRRIIGVKKIVRKIILASLAENISTNRIADKLAENIFLKK